ncbi:NAD(P) transhydrogenase subunit alpha [Stackebrandtia nassauensis]|uniref:proton-translocating NAD(P)(+) transhydrogenase n=1 Tax=Stackebrandtia nassauensis (strain DSM 44728 / CIP 108903 / NRRL B-16338 / NBRC 102104 / LLR-40K-21) TaxID=446470 RepID=D3PYS4_STANL|nr:NAD(P) transhydrogenase subunit alpha [Stackebrandtia nassauensis]ADD43507.1 alanine dehydrogenase/PNT domain protein [Stackebrandtia nassauensis DSM 44728]
MVSTTVGVVKEPSPGESRVSLIPEQVSRLKTSGLDVVVESAAGHGAHIADEEYTAAGAAVVAVDELYERADIITRVSALSAADAKRLRDGQLLAGLLEPLRYLDIMRELAANNITTASLDMLPRTLSRAQSMDVLSSQANIAGYKAAVLAADNYGRYFPMLTTAAGTSPPANALILGTGVAGLSAIGTARRLGAVVTAYDVRPESRAEVESLGARFLELETTVAASGTGGYARALTEDERAAQQRELSTRIGKFDVVITTAKVPGKTPPLLVTREALAGMRPGSVVVDLAASDLGGNVAGSEPESTIDIDGVRVIGAGNLPSVMASAASAAYSRNMFAFLSHLIDEGSVAIDLDDEINAGVIITHNRSFVNKIVADAEAA